MEWDELMELLSKVEMTDELVAEIQKSINELEDKYEKDCWERRITLEWLNKPFSEL